MRQTFSNKHWVNKWGDLYEAAPGVYCLKLMFVNVVFVRNPDSPGGPWVLVDAGLKGYGQRIKKAAEKLFGRNRPPAAIVLTHGHFDHRGALKQLLSFWKVPVYAHPMELPYLLGESIYPPADPTVNNGLMTQLSVFYPNSLYNLGDRIKPFPSPEAGLPGVPGWRILPTPGHSPGHVSFFRERDRVLIAGDAITTTDSSSILSVITQKKEVHGPPAYLTCDWDAARDSVEMIAQLAPNVIVSGHGKPFAGDRMRRDLFRMAQKFDIVERPKHGRYVYYPALIDEYGVVDLPIRPVNRTARVALGVGLAAVAGAAIYMLLRNRRNGRFASDHDHTENGSRQETMHDLETGSYTYAELDKEDVHLLNG